MEANRNLKPFINLGPGYTIKKYLDARGWSQEDLSQLTDISAKQLSKIVNDKVRITVDTARLLSKAFDNSPEFWLNLDTNYRLNMDVDSSRENATQRKSQIRKYMPVAEINKKGWFDFDNSAEGYESLYKKIWNTDQEDKSVYEKPENKYCARQKKENEEYTKFYSLTWQQIARSKAKDIDVPKYKETGLKAIIERYTEYTYSSDGIAEVINDLEKVGVKFLVLSHLSKTYLDGACFFDGDNPVIVYTARYDRIDNFWFTLAHEIAHVLLHLPKMKEQCIMDDLAEGDGSGKQEIEADRKAEEMLNVDMIVELSLPYIKYFSEAKLNEISEQLKIEKSVILGILQHKGIVDYRKLNKYKKKVVELIPEECCFG